MSETLSVTNDIHAGYYDNPNLELETDINENTAKTEKPENSASENSEELQPWILPLYNLVTANKDEVRLWPWAGVEMPLSKSMWSLGEVTADQVEPIRLQIEELLNQPVEVNESENQEELDGEDAEEDKPKEIDQNEEPKNESKKIIEKISKAKLEKQVQHEAKHPEISSSKMTKTSLDNKINMIAQPKSTGIVKSGPKQAAQTQDPINELAHTIQPEIKDMPPTPSLKIVDAGINANPISEAKSASEPTSLSLTNEAMPELQELPIFDEGSRVFFIDHSDDVLETNIEEVKTIEDFITPDVLQGDMTINFVKEEVNVIDDLTSKEPLIIIDHEQFVDDVALVEDIESPLVQIVEHIEASEPNVAEDLNEILNKIIESPIEIKIQNSENIVAEIEVQEQLEEQLAEVLNRLGIEYTPDLIESLVERVLLVKKVQKLKYQEDIEKAPQDSGTHEPLLKLLIGSASSKNTIPHVYVLGRSALWLSSFSLAA